MMTKLVTMLVVCFVPNGSTIQEAWRIEEVVTLEHCLIMNKAAAQGGPFGVITVRCDERVKP